MHFPAESDYGLEMDLVYAPRGDTIDMSVRIQPSKDMPGFEVFFASYVVTSFDETWVPLKGENGAEEWVRLENREVINHTYGIVGSSAELGRLEDGRWGKGSGHSENLDDRYFAKPILVYR